MTSRQVTGSLKSIIYDGTSSALVCTSAAASFGSDAFDGYGNA